MVVKLRPWQQYVLDFFTGFEQRVFTRQQLAQVMDQHREEFGLPAMLTVSRFIDTLLTAGQLREVEIPSEAAAAAAEQLQRDEPVESDDEDVRFYRPFARYVWGDASPYEVALSLRRGSYLSHATAVFLHGLTRQIVRTVYANKEQTPKPVPKGALAQGRIDYAFRRPPRASQYVFLYESTRLVLLNGKHTGNLEVSEIAGPAGAAFPATKLERTLIDVTVRPAYAGGVFEVLDAFRGARDRASVATLLATLRRLQYVYPYHQAIGFYMQRAGYPATALDRVAALGAEYDFYLAHQMPNPQYDRRWRVYYPNGL